MILCEGIDLKLARELLFIHLDGVKIKQSCLIPEYCPSFLSSNTAYNREKEIEKEEKHTQSTLLLVTLFTGNHVKQYLKLNANPLSLSLSPLFAFLAEH